MLRWQEEKSLLQHEMLWTQLYFHFKGEEWTRFITDEYSGKNSYARRQVDIWKTLELHALYGQQKMEEV